MGPIPAATAAEAPPLEPPGVWSRDQGFSVRPYKSFSVNQRIENAGVLVRPITMAPAARKLATTGLSSVAILFCSATLTLTVTGTPCSGPVVPPLACARSASSAAASASSAIRSTTAFSFGLTASARSRQLRTASRADTCRSRIISANSSAPKRHNSVIAISGQQFCDLHDSPTGRHQAARCHPFTPLPPTMPGAFFSLRDTDIRSAHE